MDRPSQHLLRFFALSLPQTIVSSFWQAAQKDDARFTRLAWNTASRSRRALGDQQGSRALFSVAQQTSARVMGTIERRARFAPDRRGRDEPCRVVRLRYVRVVRARNCCSDRD